MPALRGRRLGAALLVAVAGCGDPTPAPTTADPQAAYASDFAYSARRALQGTRFEELGDRWLIDVITAACAVDGGDRPSTVDALVEAAISAGDPPKGDDVDAEILRVVVAEGIDAVCPASRQAPDRAYLQLVRSAADQTGFAGLSDEKLVDAGSAVCTALGEGGGFDEAVLGVFDLLFGIIADEIGDLSTTGDVTKPEGMVVGAVLGGAVSVLCPEHRDEVAAGLERMSG